MDEAQPPLTVSSGLEMCTLEKELAKQLQDVSLAALPLEIISLPGFGLSWHTAFVLRGKVLAASVSC